MTGKAGLNTFLAELRDRKVYRVAAAYAVVAWLLIQIATQVMPFFEVPNAGVRLVVLLIVLGFPVAVALAWVFDVTPEGIVLAESVGSDDAAPDVIRRRQLKGLVLWLILSAVTIAAYLLVTRTTLSSDSVEPTAGTSSRASPSAEKSIAVLPFADLSARRDQKYFSDGISEELMSALGDIRGLRVAAPTSSFAVRQQGLKSQDMGRILGVANLLQGSVRHDGKRVRITAKLIDAGTGFNLWSESYERELDDIFKVQEEIARAIGEALKLKLAIAPGRQRAVDPEAYDLYLQGMFFSNKSDEASLRKALQLFQASLDKDPQNARAWTGIAKARFWLADVYVKPLEAYPAVRAAARKALELDATDADARTYLADTARVLDHDIRAAETGIRQALELDPNSATAHFFLGLIRDSQGFSEEGLAELERARTLDPLSPTISSLVSLQLIRERKFPAAIAELERLRALDPRFVYGSSTLGHLYREQGRFAEAIAIYRQDQRTSGIPEPGLAITYARMGKRKEAEAMLAQLEEIAATRYYAADEIATVHAALGDKDAAFAWLDRAMRERSAVVHYVGMRPEFKPLRGDPRFKSLLVRLGLDPERIAAAHARIESAGTRP